MSRPERRQLNLGFIPLNDCAPLAVAKAHGFFEEEGLEVELSREASWANVRDKIAVGALEGGHLLAPMALAASMGVGGERTPLTVPLSLNLNGSAITLSTGLIKAMWEADPEMMARRPRSARPLARVIAARREAGERPLTLAVVFAYSMHAYELRYWLAAAGVDPDRDLRLVVAPPPRMTERLRAGEIDGFCVGAPWNAIAVAEGLGEIIVRASEIWPMGPDKVLGVTQTWANAHPQALQALIRALSRAAAWADTPANRPALAGLLARPEFVGEPEAMIAQSLAPPADGGDEPRPLADIVFHRHAAGFPWRSHALWFLSQMLRWGQIGPEIDLQAVATSVYRPDLFRSAIQPLGEPVPTGDRKREGAHADPWRLKDATGPILMAPDVFLDGRVFDPEKPVAYARDFEIGRYTGEAEDKTA